MFTPCPRLIAALLALVLLPAQAAPKRDREETAPAPPPPIPQKLKVMRGQEVDIPLRIYGRKNQTLTFVIRKPPTAGRLSEPRGVDPEVGVVRYRPPDDPRIIRDVFQYAVKTGDGVSAAVPVEIEIIDIPASLVTPAELAFPQLLSGTTETQTLEIENTGGATAEGDVSVTEPWEIDGSPHYRIEPTARAIVRVRFAPTKRGSFVGEARFSSHPERLSTLKGTASDPIEITPALVQLIPEMTTLVRSGSCEIANRTTEPQRIRIIAPGRLQTESEIAIEPGQTHVLIVHTKPGDAGVLDEELRFEAGPHKASAVIAGEPLPAVLRFSPSELLVRLQASAKNDLSIENVGGLSATIQVEPGPNLRAEPATLSLDAGEKARVTVSPVSQTGPFESHLAIKTPTGTQRVVVRVAAPQPTQTLASTAHSAPRPQRASRSSIAVASAAEAEPETPIPEIKIPSYLMVQAEARTPHSCTLRWPATLSTAEKFKAQMRELGLGNDSIVISWHDYVAVRFEHDSADVRAIIEGLKPGNRYTFRIVPVESAGGTGEPIVQCTFDTPSSASHGWSLTRWIFTLAALGAMGLLVWRQFFRRRFP